MRPAHETIKNWRWWIVMPYVLYCVAFVVLPLLLIQYLGRVFIMLGEVLVDFEFVADEFSGKLTRSDRLIKWVFKNTRKETTNDN